MRSCTMSFVMAIGLACWFGTAANAQRQMEYLSRGVVAVNQGEGKVFVSWRVFGTDPDAIAFNLYRASGSAAPVKLNSQPITGATCFQDSGVDLGQATSYLVRPVLDGKELAPSKAFTLAASAPVRPYISVPLKEGLPPSDASVGDLDGDGDYEIVLKREDRGRDNSQAGITGETHLEAYKMDGTFLWRINLGKNIRSGAHYTQFMVADLDGDGNAEVACKTADGTVDGVGKVIGDANADWRVPVGTMITVPVRGNRAGGTAAQSQPATQQQAQAQQPQATQSPSATQQVQQAQQPAAPQQRTIEGHILSGPEYLTVFNGMTGAAMATVNYNPPRHPTSLKPTRQELTEIWGDGTGNRSDRYLACVAYLDGKLPSLVMCRGYYTRSTLAAYDWRDGKLTQRWFFDSDDGTPGNDKYRGQGDHQLSVADVDGDGKDEIVYGACVIDDGKGLYSTGRGHGDAMHVSDLDPDRPGLEVFMVHERPSANSGGDFRDARTGELIWGFSSTNDAGRGMTANIDPRYKGYQCWSSPSDGLYSCQGVKISDKKPRSCNFAVWWDGDLLRELLNSNVINKWNWLDGTESNLVTADSCTSNNGTKSTPALSADLFGDWREEVMWRTADNKELRIYTTTIPTTHRFYTLMHDPQYRLAIAWQNVAYNQPPHPGFYLGDGMKAPPKPNITTKAAR